MSRIYIIYKYTNIENGKVYIGQTSRTLEERAQSNGHNYCQCRKFYAAIKKYSWSSFVPEILETVETVEEANEREIYYIQLYESQDDSHGYNIAPGGDNKEMSEETRNIISSKAVARYSDKTKNPMYGRKHSDSAISRQRAVKLGEKNPMFGTHWNDTQRAKCGTLGKKLNLSDDRRVELSDHMREIGRTTGLKSIVCVEDNTVFKSIKSAADYYGVSKSTLCGHLKGRQNSCHNKHFKYVNMEGETTIETAAV